MTEEHVKQKFKETYPYFMRGDEPLSPYFDIWEYAIEIVTSEMQEGLNKIKEICELSLECKQSVFDKQIKELQDKIKDLEWQLQEVAKDNDVYQKENKELQEQIEKMKRCEICKHCH